MAGIDPKVTREVLLKKSVELKVPKLATFLVCLFFVGCATITPEARNELEVGAAVAQGNARDWRKLSPDEQERAYWKLTRAFLSVRKGVTGEEIPAEFGK